MAPSLFNAPNWSSMHRNSQSSTSACQVGPSQLSKSCPRSPQCDYALGVPDAAMSNPNQSNNQHHLGLANPRPEIRTLPSMSRAMAESSPRSSTSLPSSPDLTPRYNSHTITRPVREYLDYPIIRDWELEHDMDSCSNLMLLRSHSDPPPNTTCKPSRLLDRVLPRSKPKCGPPHTLIRTTSDDTYQTRHRKSRHGPFQRLKHGLSDRKNSLKRSVDGESEAMQRAKNRQGKAAGLSYHHDPIDTAMLEVERRFFVFFDGVMRLRLTGVMNSRGITNGRPIPAFCWVAKSPLLELYTELRQHRSGPIDLAYFYTKGFFQDCERYIRKTPPPQELDKIHGDVIIMSKAVEKFLDAKDEKTKHRPMPSLDTTTALRFGGSACASSSSHADGISPTNMEKDESHPEYNPHVTQALDVPELRLPTPLIESLAIEQLSNNAKQQDNKKGSPQTDDEEELAQTQESTLLSQDEETLQSWKKRVDSFIPSALYRKVKRTSSKVRVSLAKDDRKLSSPSRGDSEAAVKDHILRSDTPLSLALPTTSGISTPSEPVEEKHPRTLGIPHHGEPGPVDWQSNVAQTYFYSSRDRYNSLHRAEDDLRRSLNEAGEMGETIVNRVLDSREYQQAFQLMGGFENYAPFLKSMVCQAQQDDVPKESHGTDLVGGVSGSCSQDLTPEKAEREVAPRQDLRDAAADTSFSPKTARSQQFSTKIKAAAGDPLSMNKNLPNAQEAPAKHSQKRSLLSWQSLFKRKGKQTADNKQPTPTRPVDILFPNVPRTQLNKNKFCKSKSTVPPLQKWPTCPTSAPCSYPTSSLLRSSLTLEQPLLWAPSPSDTDDEAKVDEWRRNSNVLGQEIGAEIRSIDGGVAFITAGVCLH